MSETTRVAARQSVPYWAKTGVLGLLFVVAGFFLEPMLLVTLPVRHPNIFWPLAALWSFCQAIVGREYGLWIYDNAYEGEDNGKKHNAHRSPVLRALAYGLPHGVLYFVTSLSGFVAWSLAARSTSFADMCVIVVSLYSAPRLAVGSPKIAVAHPMATTSFQDVPSPPPCPTPR